MARDDHACPHRRHPGLPDLAAARPNPRSAGITRVRRSAPTCGRSRRGPRCRRRCGPRTGPTTTILAPSPTSAAAWMQPGRRPSGRATTLHDYRRSGADDATDISTQSRRCSFRSLGDRGFRLEPAAGSNGERGVAALGRPSTSASTSTRPTATCSPCPALTGTGLRPDESGYDNLVLAGDWTDCGMNAGCIEAAVMSGLEAANALLGRGRFYRIRGYWLP